MKNQKIENDIDAKWERTMRYLNLMFAQWDIRDKIKHEFPEKYFESVFQKSGQEGNLAEFQIREESLTLADLLIKLNMVKSKSEAKRLIREGAVDIDGVTVMDENSRISIKTGQTVRVGKHKFARIKKS